MNTFEMFTDPSGFSAALEDLKNGSKCARTGWNGKSMYVFLVRSDCWTQSMRAAEHHNTLRPFLAMKTADGQIVPWVASQTDLLAIDWEVVA